MSTTDEQDALLCTWEWWNALLDGAIKTDPARTPVRSVSGRPGVLPLDRVLSIKLPESKVASLRQRPHSHWIRLERKHGKPAILFKLLNCWEESKKSVGARERFCLLPEGLTPDKRKDLETAFGITCSGCSSATTSKQHSAGFMVHRCRRLGLPLVAQAARS